MLCYNCICYCKIVNVFSCPWNKCWFMKVETTYILNFQNIFDWASVTEWPRTGFLTASLFTTHIYNIFWPYFFLYGFFECKPNTKPNNNLFNEDAQHKSSVCELSTNTNNINSSVPVWGSCPQNVCLVFFSPTMITEHRQKWCCETHRYPCTVLYVSVSRACLSFIQRAVFSSIIEGESKCSPLQTQHPLHNVTLAANPFIPLLCSPILSSVFDLCGTAN